MAIKPNHSKIYCAILAVGFLCSCASYGESNGGAVPSAPTHISISDTINRSGVEDARSAIDRGQIYIITVFGYAEWAPGINMWDEDLVSVRRVSIIDSTDSPRSEAEHARQVEATRYASAFNQTMRCHIVRASPARCS